MSICQLIHDKLNEFERFNYPFYKEDLPQSGIYVIFENREIAHGGDRIVHIGTHIEDRGLERRICEIFEKENKNRSILRKNIGRCILSKQCNEYIRIWDKDTTSANVKKEMDGFIDIEFERKIEEQITKHIVENFSFVVIPENDKTLRKEIKNELISEISRCKQCGPSLNWLGSYSTKIKIKESGLWNEQGLYKENLTNYIVEKLEL